MYERENKNNSYMTSRITASIIAIVTLITICFASNTAHTQGLGDLLVAPTRVEFEGRKRSTELTLVNRGTGKATYRISFQNMMMEKDGTYKVIEEPENGELFADRILRYAPRQITLEAGETQTVRVMTRKKRNLEQGEYRSHMLFKAVPPEDTGKTIESVKVKKGQLAVRLTPIFGISIPVIVRHGDLEEAIIKVTDAKVTSQQVGEETKYFLEAEFSRQGKKSVYGDMKVTYGSDSSGEYIGELRGISIFTPYTERSVKIPLNLTEGLSGGGGKIHFFYHERNNEHAILTQQVVNLQ